MNAELPRSTADRAYLLAWNVEKKKLIGWSRRGQVTNAAALIDLWHAGLLTAEGRKDRNAVARAGTAREFDGPEAAILARVAASGRYRSWKTWIRKSDRETERAVRERLAAARVIRSEPHRTLGFRWYRVEVRDTRLVRELVSRCRRAVLDGVPVDRVEQQDAALVALVAAAEWNTVFSGAERRKHRDRIKDLAIRSGPAAKALRDVIDSDNAAAASSGGA